MGFKNAIFYCYIIISTLVIYIALNKICKEGNKSSISNINLVTKLKNNKKIKFNINKINALIEDLDYKYYINNVNIFSYISYIIFSLLCFVIGFSISYNSLNLITTSIIVGIGAFFIPYIILNILIIQKKKKIAIIFPSYLANLKNYTKVDNNIISAMSKTKVGKPLNKYIEIFNTSVKNGIPIYDSFEVLKNNINIDKISEFITLIQHATINGGDVSNILDKYAKLQMKINLRNEKEKQNISSSKLALISLVAINIYILFGFILSDNHNFSLITTTLIGEIILNINIISFGIVGYMYYKINDV